MDLEQARADADRYSGRMEGYRQELQEDREAAVKRFLKDIRSGQATDLSLEPMHAVYSFDEDRALAASEPERIRIFQRTLWDLDTALAVRGTEELPTWGIVRFDQAKAALNSGDLERAENIATCIREEADDEFPWLRDDDSIHESEQLLGQLALRKGDKAEAVRHLLASVEVNDGPVMCSFGPRLRLANELLDVGETEAVLSYLEKVREFWECGPTKVAAWIKAMKAGRDPRDENWRFQLRY